MKKAKFLSLALAAAIGLTGAGYAYWNDAVTINSTVGTGKVETYFKDVTAGKTEDLVVKVNGNVNNAAKATVTYTDNRNATLTITNLFPGASVEKEFEIQNNSTMPLQQKTLGIMYDGTAKPNDLVIKGEFTVNGKTYTVDNIIGSTGVMTAQNTPAIEVGKNMKIKLTVSVPNDSNFEDQSVTLKIAPEFTQFNDPAGK